jgi:hypothetical protein
MSDCDKESPISRKSGIFSRKGSKFSNKDDPYSRLWFCPALLQENSYALLLEDGNKILLE